MASHLRYMRYFAAIAFFKLKNTVNIGQIWKTALLERIRTPLIQLHPEGSTESEVNRKEKTMFALFVWIVSGKERDNEILR